MWSCTSVVALESLTHPCMTWGQRNTRAELLSKRRPELQGRKCTVWSGSGLEHCAHSTIILYCSYGYCTVRNVYSSTLPEKGNMAITWKEGTYMLYDIIRHREILSGTTLAASKHYLNQKERGVQKLSLKTLPHLSHTPNPAPSAR